MAQTSAERDLQRAAELRKQSKGVQSARAKADLNLAADRLEERGARKAKKLGRSKSKPVQTFMR